MNTNRQNRLKFLYNFYLCKSEILSGNNNTICCVLLNELINNFKSTAIEIFAHQSAKKIKWYVGEMQNHGPKIHYLWEPQKDPPWKCELK